ncbi:MAG: UDP-3-O-(3-hydroxymyristoyl)glucosamine N-acyltransferase, partial [Verrucomicrobiota bacterium]
VIGDASILLTGSAPPSNAKTGDLTFAENAEYFAAAEQSAASAILVAGDDFQTAKKTLIKVPNARVAFARVLPLFFPEPSFAPGSHPSAVVETTASIDPTAYVGANCFVGAGAKVGARCVLERLVSIGENAIIGADTRIFPNVTVYQGCQIGDRVIIHAGTVVGSDGFGYVFDQGQHRKVPQVGIVILGDEVELGANVTIDRGALGPTVIGKGTKIDNLVQIGHNVIIGEHCIIISQTGIAGSNKLGNFVTVAGQVGLAGHLTIGDRVTITAQSGVMHDIPAGEKWMGSPAQPDKQAKRQMLAMQQLPELIRRVKELERQAKKN